MQSNITAHAPQAIKLLLTVNEAASALSLGRSAMYDLLLSGEIPSIKIGRTRRVPLHALEAYIQHQLERLNA